MTKLVLIRHAQSLHNANAIIGGDPDLTEKGRDQAVAAGRKLSEKYGDDFDFMVISGMKRTNQTAEIINQFLNVENISYDGELKEKHYGIYENKDLNKHRSDIHFLKEVIPGGDSETVFIARITKALCGYLKGEESLAIIVTHCGVMRAANNYFLGNPEYIENAAFTELSIEEIPDFAGKCAMVGDDIGVFENILGEL